jgi:multiple sugar transport system permease protein
VPSVEMAAAEDGARPSPGGMPGGVPPDDRGLHPGRRGQEFRIDGPGARRLPRPDSRCIGLGLSAPAGLGLVLLVLGPAAALPLLALTDWQFGVPGVALIGLRNFAALAADETFRAACLNTVLYWAMVVPATLVGGLALALAVDSRPSLRAFYRAVHFLPYMTTMAAMSIVWEALLHPTSGPLAVLLATVGLQPVNWLRDEATALPTLAVIGIWKNLGFAMVLFLAGLKAVPGELIDAAEVDGVRGMADRLRLVLLPALKPVTMFVAVALSIKSAEVFDTVRVLTQGGPGNRTEVLLYVLHTEAFQYLKVGYGAAITCVFLALVALLTAAQYRLGHVVRAGP